MWNVIPGKVKTSKVTESGLANKLSAISIADANNRVLEIQAVYTGATELTYVIFYQTI
jgi:hypothetical protein